MFQNDGFEGFGSLTSKKGKVEEPEVDEFELEKMEEMRQNDREIDEMLDVAIDKLGRLDFHAQDIVNEVDLQAKKLK